MDNKTKYNEALRILKDKINSIEEPNARREFLQVINNDTEQTIANIENNNHLNPISVDMMWSMALIGVEGMIEAVDDYLKNRTR